MPAFNTRIERALANREQQGLSRSLRALQGSNQVRFTHHSRQFVNFSSNDYLGLASDRELVKAWQEGLDKYGCGSGASPLVTGFNYAHQALENQLCDWLGYERAVLFGSGFSANQALLFTLLCKDDVLIQDKLNHASLMEAGMLSPATMKRFRHNDIDHLAQLIDSGDAAKLVVTEGVFSMDGDQASLADIIHHTQGKAWLAVDDAHGIGILGRKGAGSCDAAGVKPDIVVATFGKAFGLSGAAILCNASVGDYLTQFARHHVYSTAMPPAQAHALAHAAQMIQSQQWRRDKLVELSESYDAILKGLPGYVATDTTIKPFVTGSAERALDIAEQMKQSGCWMTAIRPPTVPQGRARLRITLTASHQVAHVQHMAESLLRCLEENA